METRKEKEGSTHAQGWELETSPHVDLLSLLMFGLLIPSHCHGSFIPPHSWMSRLPFTDCPGNTAPKTSCNHCLPFPPHQSSVLLRDPDRLQRRTQTSLGIREVLPPSQPSIPGPEKEGQPRPHGKLYGHPSTPLYIGGNRPPAAPLVPRDRGAALPRHTHGPTRPPTAGHPQGPGPTSVTTAGTCTVRPEDV